ncbi:MAG TPA: hypothetical protein VG845_12210 [Dehalococcoidia bacterium]|jgi:hypothetical protein|nr:hypothetical protein [Dehalococcoidia bacterium]
MLVGIGIALVIAGIALIVALEGLFGELLLVIGAGLLLWKLIRSAEGDITDRQSEMEARQDDIRAKHQSTV